MIFCPRQAAKQHTSMERGFPWPVGVESGKGAGAQRSRFIKPDVPSCVGTPLSEVLEGLVDSFDSSKEAPVKRRRGGDFVEEKIVELIEEKFRKQGLTLPPRSDE